MGETPVFPLPLPHFLSMTPASPRPLPPHQGTMGETEDGGKRNGGASLFPSLPLFTLGDPYLADTLHSWPLFLASSSVTSVPSLTLVPSPPLIPGVRAAGLCQAPASPTTPVSRGPPEPSGLSALLASSSLSQASPTSSISPHSKHPSSPQQPGYSGAEEFNQGARPALHGPLSPRDDHVRAPMSPF